MEMCENDLLSSCLNFPENFVITSVCSCESQVAIHVRCRKSTAACPSCGHWSERIHDRYVRTVADVPCAARRVVLKLTVRKFVCCIATCTQKTFTERLPELVEAYARMTNRLQATLQAIGLVAGGEAGTRLAAKLGIATAPATLLCHLMSMPLPARESVRVLGVDDWSWKRRHRYGTILVDLEKGQIIDVLAERTAEALTQWLRAHPEIEVISRDRGTDYASAAREAAPQALQIADRFHLIRNLADVLQRILSRCRAEIRRVDQDRPPQEPPSVEAVQPLPSPSTWQQKTPSHVEHNHQARQASRDDRFQQVMSLRERGLTQAEIAKRVGISEKSVRAWLKRGTAPTYKRSSRRRSIFDPYAPYVLERWQQGVREGKQLYEEIRAKGFSGSVRVVQRFLQALNIPGENKPEASPASVADQFSAHAATWLFLREPEQLTNEEQAELQVICQRSATAEQTYHLAQAFVTMARMRTGQHFDNWFSEVEASHVPELRRFAHNLLKDKEAVVAGLTEKYSNGPVEAHVHKLKLVKRSMFGRAKLPLLKQRLLHTL